MNNQGSGLICILVITALGSLTLAYSLIHFDFLSNTYKIRKSSENKQEDKQLDLYQEVISNPPSKQKINCLSQQQLCFLQQQLLLDYEQILSNQNVIFVTDNLIEDYFQLNQQSMLIVQGSVYIKQLELISDKDFIIIASNGIRIDQINSNSNNLLHVFSYLGGILVNGYLDTEVIIYQSQSNIPDDLSNLKDLLGKLVLERIPLGLNMNG